MDPNFFNSLITLLTIVETVDNSVDASEALGTTTVKVVYRVVEKSVDNPLGCELKFGLFAGKASNSLNFVDYQQVIHRLSTTNK